MQTEIKYELKLVNTEAATGFFSCVPDPDPGLEQGFELLRSRPFDDFLRKHLIRKVLTKPVEQVAALARHAAGEKDATVLSLFHEARKISGDGALDLPEPGGLAESSSLTYLRGLSPEQQKAHNSWKKLLRKNLVEHQVPEPDESAELPILYETRKKQEPEIAIDFAMACPRLAESDRRPAEETIAHALQQLNNLDVLEGSEKRHVASLSPIAVFRQWRLQIAVDCGRNLYRLKGLQTSYGRGLSPEAARAACLMEIVERISSFVSICGDRLVNAGEAERLAFGNTRQLEKNGKQVLDPNRMRLDVPYNDESLYWIKGRNCNGDPVYVPAQAVFLFCNLDEPSLFSSLGSTGLAAGNTPAEAKLSGLLEVIERDADGVIPFDPRRCFELYTDNPYLQPLFQAYREKGIAIGFQDITSEFGIPAYRCFVKDPKGQIVQGTGAHLDGRKAVISALTETAYPFPSGPPSAPGPKGLPRRRFEDLPNFDTNCSARNLKLVNDRLQAYGFEPIYVDLTRSDIEIPVFRALVPGLEWLDGFDRFSRVSPRLYRNYLEMIACRNDAG